MAQGDSMVVVGLVFNNGPASPILKVVASDPDGIDMIEIFSRHNANLPVEIARPILACPFRDQQEFANFPQGWFPITVRLTDCTNRQNPRPRLDKLHGPFDENGNITDSPVPQPQPEQPKPSPKPPDFDDPTDVGQLPLVITRAEVVRLLGVSDAELDTIIDRGDLTAFGPTRARITKGSLAKLLGL
ncbi:MAG TPA: hypothetical protein VJH03_09735 [Blastocatellia bacterium]|nr:hypothetical protein [Blastocatellia bacterium]